ncbi:hypothetical protein TBR22_A29650 [Luteitalea sp. TBR-22]|uniref:BACON domain-containing protein n=1 Tax=Luteitalea sp. TBR-22 TaxID=2802971 RepID=UPI001AF6340C|nr:BACON domain-containing carbohydrate-binding protein [Luteitalea sp. TBR-22]BCS33738.1 hypothetical protein TBR22_A29650 [Luteitalea sp. TBR-22]
MLALLTVGCGGSSSTQTTAPTAITRCAVGLATGASAPVLAAEGGTASVSVTVNRECTWEARSTADWLAVTSPSSGQGNATLAVTAAPNPAGLPRVAVVNVNDSRLEVQQAAAACRLLLDSPGRRFAADGGSARVDVQVPDGCAWAAVTDVTWLALDGSARGTGRGSLVVTVAANEGSPRTATVRVGSVEWIAAQDAPVPTMPGPGVPPTTPAPSPAPAPGPPAPPVVGDPAPPGPSPTPSPAPPTPAPAPAPGPTPSPAPPGDPAPPTPAPPTPAPPAPAPPAPPPTPGPPSPPAPPTPAPPAPEPTPPEPTPTPPTPSPDPGPPPTAPVVEEVRLEGRVSNRAGTCPTLTFQVDGRLVRTSTATHFIADRCERVVNGASVDVRGTRRPDGAIDATRVQVANGNGQDDGAVP